MNENEAFATLAGMGIMMLVVAGALALAVSIFYYLTLHQTMNAISEVNRPLAGGLVWLALIPFVGVIWYMVYIILLSNALKREAAQRGLPGDGAAGVSLALAILLALCFVPYANLIAVIPAIALWVIHWARMAGYRKLLQAAQPALAT
ncbi:hypothetical protein KIF53_11820 [Chromobacterium subtsugae]|uniref:DUF4234 domain-containing protein n=1 Tax=Chromobacterium subtsugae TaxID=251747 RepID=A0ABS7FE20_9NEIS|nr:MULTISPECIES: hypothetical protein [Chromobacterium]KUM03861.1 hypothetical protein Cv017_17570 [Chromobacterium subtsugae]KZE87478.1 hypothetical protein AWB61_11440 [Chromobacterium sp. F49]MBW7566627.1 hypothetical protein [Chromobacterium subtsugae]MBW8288314.1 hypothetical protein [Chromobacterium subtsugae]OBU87237.1 hypothetical protein MY55_07045 [Chromobacterium subtsugae]